MGTYNEYSYIDCVVCTTVALRYVPVAKFFINVVPSLATSFITVQYTVFPPPPLLRPYNNVFQNPPTILVAVNKPTGVTKFPTNIGDV